MNEKILVVDDEKEIADLLEVYLKNDNYILILFLTKHQNITMKMLKVSRQVPYLMTII